MLSKLRAAGAIILALVTVFVSYSPLPAFAQAVQVPPGEVCFSATTGLNGMVGVLGTITGGSGGTAGTYTNVALTGGTGTGATANITVSSGGVTVVSILSPGANYTSGDTLSALSANIGNVTGFSVVVNSISINSSLAGGSVGMYIPGTLTPSSTWQDRDQTMLNTDPIGLDANGCATIWGIGTYRQIVYDRLGNEVWDKITSVAPTNPYYAGVAGGTANAITVTDAQFAANDGQAITFLALHTNTGAVTITPSGTGSPISVLKNTASGPVPLTGGEIVGGSPGNLYTVVYSATYSEFILGAYPDTTSANFINAQPVQATDYGLVCNGSANPTTNTAAVYAALSAAMSTGRGLQFPVGDCPLNAMTWDFAPVNVTGIKIMGVSHGQTILDFSSVTTGTALQLEASGGTTGNPNTWLYSTISDLTVLGNTTGTLCAIGKTDFSDVINFENFSDLLCFNVDGVNTGKAMQLNYVLDSVFYLAQADGFVTGTSYYGTALECDQCEFNTFVSGSFGNAAKGVVFTNGISFGNVFTAPDVENVNVGWTNNTNSAGGTSIFGGQNGNCNNFGIQSSAASSIGSFDFYNANFGACSPEFDTSNMVGVRFHDQLSVATPTFPLTGVTVTNKTGKDVLVTFWGGTVASITINGFGIGLTSGSVFLPAAGTVSLTYTGSPVWSWTRVN